MRTILEPFRDPDDERRQEERRRRRCRRRRAGGSCRAGHDRRAVEADGGDAEHDPADQEAGRSRQASPARRCSNRRRAATNHAIAIRAGPSARSTPPGRERTPDRTVATPKSAKPTTAAGPPTASPSWATVSPMLPVGHVALVDADHAEPAEDVPDRADGRQREGGPDEARHRSSLERAQDRERERAARRARRAISPTMDAAVERERPEEGPEPRDREGQGAEDGGDAAEAKRHGESPSG